MAGYNPWGCKEADMSKHTQKQRGLQTEPPSALGKRSRWKIPNFAPMVHCQVERSRGLHASLFFFFFASLLLFWTQLTTRKLMFALQIGWRTTKHQRERKNPMAQDAFCQVSPNIFIWCVTREMPPTPVQFIMYIRQITRCNLSQMLELKLPIHTSPGIASAHSFRATFSHRCSSSVEFPRHSLNTAQSSMEQETLRTARGSPGNRWGSCRPTVLQSCWSWNLEVTSQSYWNVLCNQILLGTAFPSKINGLQPK